MVAAQVLVNAVDGLYLDTNHYTQQVDALRVEPLGTSVANFISDIKADNEYYDNPATDGRNVAITGTVAAGGTYQNIEFTGCLFRGALSAKNCIRVDIADAGGFSSGGKRVENIRINGGTLRQANDTALLALGNSAGKLEVYGLSVQGAILERNNSAGTAAASCASVQVEGFTWLGNTVLPDTVASTNLVSVNLSLAESGNPSFTYGRNDYSKANNTGDAYNLTSTVGAQVSGGGDIFPGAGLDIDQVYKTSTTGKSPKIIWQMFISGDGQLGQVKALTQGCSTSGTAGSVRAIYENRAGFYRESAGNLALTGASEIFAHSVITGHSTPVTLTRLTGPAWAATTALTAGDRVVSGGRMYLAMTNGTTGGSDPTHTAGVVTNGSVDLGYVADEAPNTVAIVVCGQGSTDMSWSSWVQAIVTP